MDQETLSSLIVSGAPYSEIEQWISRSPSSVNEGFIYVEDANGPYAMTPLHHAVAKIRWDVVRLLVEKGADIDARCALTRGQTPLHLALNTVNNTFVTMPRPILSLLRSDYNVNVLDGWNKTPLTHLLSKVYSVYMMKEELDQSRVDSGQDVVVGGREHLLWVRRCIPVEVMKAFATKENVMMLPDNFVNRMHRIAGQRTRWDLLLHFVSLGVEMEKILTSLGKDQAQTAPAFVLRLLSSMRQRGKVAKWEYMPYVYVETNRQPLSLHLSAALAVKRRVGYMQPSEELRTLQKLKVPELMANYVANLEQEVEEECNANKAPVTQDHLLEDVSW